MELYKIAAANLKGIGRNKLKQICSRIGSLNGVFEKSTDELSAILEVKKDLVRNMGRKGALEQAEYQLAFNHKYGIQTLYHEDSHYPDLLKECPDAPISFFFKGSINLNQSKAISIVGTRKASSYGQENVEQIISSLKGKNIIVVSGLAYGIDTFVHECCLKYQIPTIGVLAHGHHTIYPKSNGTLAKKMTRQGGLLSEFGIHEPLSKWNFPKRNRIIAGLSELTIVIESPSKGGSLITAEMANGYNREVMAVPGPLFCSNSSGCNELIKNQKAHMMTSPGDVFSIMDWDENYFVKDMKYDLKPEEKVLVTFLMNKTNSTFDQLTEGTKFSAALLQSIILKLELNGIIHSLPGSRFKINHRVIGQSMV